MWTGVVPRSVESPVGHLNPDGSRLVTGAADGTALVWTANGSDTPLVLTGQANIVLAAVRAELHSRFRPSVQPAKQLRPRRWTIAGVQVAKAEGQPPAPLLSARHSKLRRCATARTATRTLYLRRFSASDIDAHGLPHGPRIRRDRGAERAGRPRSLVVLAVAVGGTPRSAARLVALDERDHYGR